MIPAAVGEAGSSGKAIGERTGTLAGGRASSGDGTTVTQSPKSWRTELAEQLSDPGGRIFPDWPTASQADLGPGTGVATGLALAWNSNSGELASGISGRAPGTPTEPDSETEASFVDLRTPAAASAAAGGPHYAPAKPKPASAASLDPQRASLNNRSGVVPPQAREAAGIPAQRKSSSSSAEHATATASPRRFSELGNAGISAPVASHTGGILSQITGPISQGIAPSDASEASRLEARLAEPASERISRPTSGSVSVSISDRADRPVSGHASGDGPQELSAGSLFPAAALPRTGTAADAQSWPQTKAAAAIPTSARRDSVPSQTPSLGSDSEEGLPHLSGIQEPESPSSAGDIPSPAVRPVFGHAALHAPADTPGDGLPSGVSPSASPAAVGSQSVQEDSRHAPPSAPQPRPKSASGVREDESRLGMTRLIGQNAAPPAGTSPAVGMPVFAAPKPVAELSPEIYGLHPSASVERAAAPAISANAVPAMPRAAAVPRPANSVPVADTPTPATLDAVSGEWRELSVEQPISENGLRPGTQPAAPSQRIDSGLSTLTDPAIAKTVNRRVEASFPQVAANPVAPAVVSSPVSAPEPSLRVSAEPQARVIVAGPPRQPPEGSRAAATRNIGVPAAITHPGTGQVAVMSPNVEGKTDLPEWLSSSSRSDANPNPFQFLDASGATVPAWTARGGGIAGTVSSAGGSHLQVGYQDPVLGYVELRAHSDGTGVHASLGTQSDAGHAALSGDLSALSAWMDLRHTPVESLSVVALHGTPDGPSNLANGHAGAKEFAGQSPDRGAGAELGSGSNAGHPSGNGSDPGSEAARLLPAGNRSGRGYTEQPSQPVARVEQDSGFPAEDGFAVGSSISILA